METSLTASVAHSRSAQDQAIENLDDHPERGQAMRIAGRWPVRFVLLTTCALAVVGGVAYANSGSSSTTVIRACRNKASGLLRVVNAGANCRTGEALLSWNVDGPAGPSGPTGPKGDSGAAGAAGPQGGSGGAGPTGPTGPPGTPGLVGPPGPSGSQGVSVYAVQPSNHCATRGFDIYQEDASLNDALIGPLCDGAAGATGLAGAKGAKGDPGAAGATGPAGPTGGTGPAGATGAAGAAGAPGPQGTAGASGPQGAPGQDGSNGAQGPKGDTGDAGSAGPAGPQGPKGDTGAQGAKGDPGAGIQVTAFGTAHPGPGVSTSLLVIPNVLTVDIADCYLNPGGSYSSDVSFTNTSLDDLWTSGGLLAAGATSGSAVNLSIADQDPTTSQPAHAQRDFIDWETRTTISVYLAAQPHTGSADDNSLGCAAKAFAVIDSP